MTRYIILQDSDLRFAYGYANETPDNPEAINGSLYVFLPKGTDATLFSNWGEAHAIALKLYELYPDQHFSVVDITRKDVPDAR